MNLHGAKGQVRALYTLTFIVLAFQAWGTYNTNHQAYVSCIHTQHLQQYAKDTITRSRATLPTIAYYKNPDHANELSKQLKLLDEAEASLPPLTCHKSFWDI